MTEDEAKTKWCPMAKVGTNCIGSACMMWRRNETQERKWVPASMYPSGWHYTGNTRGDNTGGQEQEYYRNVEGGFCGLAGLP